MKRLITATLFGLCLFLLAGCFGQPDGRFPEFPEKPSTAPMKGYQWETVSGAGLKFWAQRDSQNRVITDALLHGADARRLLKRGVDGGEVVPLLDGKLRGEEAARRDDHFERVRARGQRHAGEGRQLAARSYPRRAASPRRSE